MMRAARRILTLALLVLALGALAPGAHPAAPPPAAAAQPTSHGVPIAIDLGTLFGDENEPDEDEPDEGSPRAVQPPSHGSGVSLPVVAVLVVLAGAFGAYVYVRIRRLYRRIVEWSRGMWARS
jgi:hypothetical protein